MPSPSTNTHVHPPHKSNHVSPVPVERVPLLDVGRENTPLETKILAAISQVTRSGRFVMGPECQQLEQRIAKLCGVSHAIGCGSGTDALLLALMANDIRPGDEVIVPSFTFFATASAVWRLGAVPVFVDIDPDTFNLDPEKLQDAVTSQTKAVIPVHLFGQSAEMSAINTIAKEHQLTVIEDAAQALGADFDGQPVGSLGHVGCFSFYPTKNLGGFGDGGMLTTNSDEMADKLRLLRVHGMQPRYYHEIVGTNSRLDTIQAAVLNVKLPNLTIWKSARRDNARRYQQLFRQAGVGSRIELPAHSPRRTHVWNQYTIRVRDGLRNALREFLNSHGIGTEIYYPIPLHRQTCFRSLAQDVDLPETERAAAEVLSLPIFPTMTQAEQQTVVLRIGEFFATQKQQSAAAKLPHIKSHPSSSQPLQSL